MVSPVRSEGSISERPAVTVPSTGTRGAGRDGEEVAGTAARREARSRGCRRRQPHGGRPPRVRRSRRPRSAPGAGAVREVAADQQEEGQHDRRVEVGARAGGGWSRGLTAGAIRIAIEIGTSMSSRRARRARSATRRTASREGDCGQGDRRRDPVHQVAGGVARRPTRSTTESSITFIAAKPATAMRASRSRPSASTRVASSAALSRGRASKPRVGQRGISRSSTPGRSSTVAAARFSVRLTRAAATPASARSARSTPAMQAAQWIEGSDRSIRRSGRRPAGRGAGRRGSERRRRRRRRRGRRRSWGHAEVAALAEPGAVGRGRDDLGAPAARGEVGGRT